MLPSEFRLTKKRDFGKVYAEGKSFVSDLLVMYILPNEKNSKTRIGFSISKKVGKAVIRNKIKRLMSESLKEYLSLIKSNFDIIFIARSKSSTSDFKSIKESIEFLLKKAGLIKQGFDKNT